MQSSRLYYSSRLLQVSTRTLLGLERISVILGILGVSRLISTCLTSQLHQIIPSYFLLGEIINSSIRHKLSYTSVFSPLMLKYPMNNYALLSKRYRVQIRAVKIKRKSLCKVKWYFLGGLGAMCKSKVFKWGTLCQGASKLSKFANLLLKPLTSGNFDASWDEGLYSALFENFPKYPLAQ